MHLKLIIRDKNFKHRLRTKTLTKTQEIKQTISASFKAQKITMLSPEGQLISIQKETVGNCYH